MAPDAGPCGTPSSGEPRLGPRRHVRADRGHRPDGVPAADLARHPAPRPSASRSRAAACGSRRRRRRGRRRRRARLHRAERDDGVRRARRPTSPAGPSSPSCAPVTWPGRPTTGSGRSAAGSTGTPRSSASGSTSPGSRPPPTVPDGCSCPVERRPARLRRPAAGDRRRARRAHRGQRAARPARSAGAPGRPDPDHGRGQAGLAALRRHAGARCDRSASTSAGAAAEDLRDLLAVTARPPGRRPRRQLRRPRRRLARRSSRCRRGSAGGSAHLPPGWQHLTPRELAARARAVVGSRPRGDPVLLRALAIVAIVVSPHRPVAAARRCPRAARRRRLQPRAVHAAGGGACCSGARGSGCRGGARRARRRCGSGVGALAGDYRPADRTSAQRRARRRPLDRRLAVLVPRDLGVGAGRVALLLALPAVDRWQRRSRSASRSLRAGASLALAVRRGRRRGRAARALPRAVDLWCVALGWAAAEARGTPRRVSSSRSPSAAPGASSPTTCSASAS